VVAANRPTEGIALMNFLEDSLRSCARDGCSYAPIFLRRKWELQRATGNPLGYIGNTIRPDVWRKDSARVD